MRSKLANAQGKIVRKSIAVLAGTLLLGGVSVVGGGVVDRQQAFASTNGLTTAASIQSLSAAIDAQIYSAATPTAIVTSAGTPAVVAQAAALAGGLNEPLVISDSTTDATTTASNLATLHATHVRLIGKVGSFSAAFTSSLAQSVAIDSTIADDSDFNRSISIAAPLGAVHIVVTMSTAPTDVRIAANYAVMHGYPLILLDGTESAANVTSFFSGYAGVAITLVGAAQNLSSDVPDNQTEQLDVLDTTDPTALDSQLAYRTVTEGNTATDVYAAPSDQLGAIALTALEAHAKRGISIPAGTQAALTTASALTSYLTLWAGETSQVHLIGTGLTSANLTTVEAPTLIARNALPAWYATGTTLGSGTWQLNYTALSGATTYEAFDVFGDQAGAISPTTDISITGTPTAETVVGYTSTGAEAGRFEYRINQYQSATDLDSAVIGSTKDGTNYLQFLGTLKVPRIITRTTTDPLQETPTSTTSIVAITCLGYFVDSGLDATKEYTYDVQTQGGSANRACDSTATQSPTSFTSVKSSAITLPLTSFPATAAASASFARPMSTQSMTMAQHATAAMPTMSDAALLRAMGKPTRKSIVFDAAEVAKSSGLSPQASSLPDYAVRYQAFIPNKYVPFPGFSGDVSHPTIAFGGDDRAGGISYGNFRIQATMLFHFQSSPQRVDFTPATGITHEYKCQLFYADCVLTQQGQASTAGIKMPTSTISGNVATAHVVVSVADPLVSYAPKVDGDLTFVLRPGNSVIYGSHDAYPVHEVFSGLLPGDYATDYVSKYSILACLYGEPAQLCVIKLNRTL